MAITTFSDILERTTRVYTATVKDEAGVVVPATSLSTLVLTLYSIHTDAIINNRNAQNVLNANNVTVDTNGVLTWIMQPADNTILDGGLHETHVALFEWTYAGGTKAGKHEARFVVTNLVKVM